MPLRPRVSRSRQRYSRRRRFQAWHLWVPTLGAAAVALAVGTALASGGTEHAANSASLSGIGSSVSGAAQAGGWGRGGYPMMTGPAGADGTGTNGTGANGAPANAAVNAAQTSVNWAGYAATGAAGTFSSVSSSWTEPVVTCGAANTFSSFWVGLDGDGSQTVEQTGTEADCANGTATYAGWWEMFPNAPVFYNNPVNPGDAMSASVVANGGGAFTLTLSDTTQGWTQTTNQTSAAAQLASAEVIAEAPSNGTVLPLSNFGTVNFSNAAVNNAPIGNSGASTLTMVSAGGVTEATPSALTGGNSFTVTWDSSGAPAAGTASTAAPSPGASMGGSPGTGTSPGPGTSQSPGTGTPQNGGF
jgi:hypothetical protein